MGFSLVRQVSRFFIFLVFFLQDSFQLLIREWRYQRTKKDTKRIQIIKPDGIGDFILLLPFLNTVSSRLRQTGWKMTLILNLAVKDFSHLLDREVADDIIWINYSRFRKVPWYRWNWLKLYGSLSAEVSLFPVSSREFRGIDAIARFCTSARRVTMKNDLVSVYLSNREVLWSDRYYTTIIPAPDTTFFEFLLLKNFFRNCGLEADWPERPYLKIHTPVPSDLQHLQGTIILFPGAAQLSRQWQPMHFASVILQLNNLGFGPFVICGGSADSTSGELIATQAAPAPVLNLCGKTSLTSLAILISEAKLLISNETGAVHLAVAQNTPVVCVSNGNHLMRYSPYPSELNSRSIYVYPPEIEVNGDPRVLYERFRFGSDLDINLVTPGVVVESAITLLTRAVRK